MEGKTKKAVGIGLGVGALALLGIALYKARPKGDENPYNLPPVVTPPPVDITTSDWLSRMPAVPNADGQPQVDVGCLLTKANVNPFTDTEPIELGDEGAYNPDYETYMKNWAFYLAKEELMILSLYEPYFEEGYGIEYRIAHRAGQGNYPYPVYELTNVRSIFESNTPGLSLEDYSMYSYPTHWHTGGYVPMFSITGDINAADAYTWVPAIAPTFQNRNTAPTLKTPRGITLGYPYKERFPYFIATKGWDSAWWKDYYTGWSENYPILTEYTLV